MKNHKMRGVCICALAMLMLVGCGEAKLPDVVDVTSIAVTDDGTVTSYLVEEFDKEYYDVSDLMSMAVAEAADYNTEHQSGENVALTVEKVEALDDGSNKVVVVHKYDSADTFSDYNGGILFYGTVEKAVQEGYDLDAALNNVKDGTLMTKDQLLQEPARMIVITDQKAVIYCPAKVAYVSDGAVYHADGSVDATQAEDKVMIIMK